MTTYNSNSKHAQLSEYEQQLLTLFQTQLLLQPQQLEEMEVALTQLKQRMLQQEQLLEQKDRELMNNQQRLFRLDSALQQETNESAIYYKSLQQQKFALDQAAMVLVLDSESHLLYANQKYFQRTGFRGEQLLNQYFNLVDLELNEQAVFGKVWETVKSGEVWRGELQCRTITQESYWVDATIVPSLGSRGEILQYLGIFFDLTQIKQAEAKLQEAKHRAEYAHQIKSDFLANISHELRTPLHGILSFADLGVRKAKDSEPEKLIHYFESIKNSGERLLKLLNELLSLSKLQAGKMPLTVGFIDLYAVFQNVTKELEALAAEKEIRVVIEAPAASSNVHGDENLMRQVATNLIGNAIKFSPKQKTVQVTFGRCGLKGNQVSKAFDAEPAISVRIKDEGKGIPTEEIEDIFKSFVQSSRTNQGAGGTGLGLAISKEIICRHRGVIFAENNHLSKGSSFIIVLPIKQLANLS